MKRKRYIKLMAMAISCAMIAGNVPVAAMAEEYEPVQEEQDVEEQDVEEQDMEDPEELCQEKSVEVEVEDTANASVEINGEDTTHVTLGTDEDYTVTVKPDNGYAVEDVQIDGEETEISYNAQTATVTGNTGDESNVVIEVSVKVIPCGIETHDAEINYYTDMGMDQTVQNIFDAVVDSEKSVPQVSAEDVEIEYDASENGAGTWKAIDFQPGFFDFWSGLHRFGMSSERVRIVYAGTEKYPEIVSAPVVVNLKDNRKHAQLSFTSEMQLQYQSAEDMDRLFKEMLAENAVVTGEDGKVIDTTEDDFSYSPSASKWSAGEQEVTVKFKANEEYQSCEAVTTLAITKADASIHVNSQEITYGETFSDIFTCNPKDAEPVGMIIGVEGEGKTFVGADVSNVLPEGMLPETMTVDELSTIISMLPSFGVDEGTVSAIEKVINKAVEIYPEAKNYKVHFRKPTQSGVYLAVGANANSNYKTAIGTGYLTIKPKKENVSLAFKNELPKNKTLTYEEAKKFEFGGKLIVDGQDTDVTVKTRYSGITADNRVITNSKTPIRRPGRYVETIYLSKGNYVVKSVRRSYIVKKQISVPVFQLKRNRR